MNLAVMMVVRGHVFIFLDPKGVVHVRQDFETSHHMESNRGRALDLCLQAVGDCLGIAYEILCLFLDLVHLSFATLTFSDLVHIIDIVAKGCHCSRPKYAMGY